MERKLVKLDGKSYMATRVAADEKEDDPNYTYVKDRCRKIWKIPNFGKVAGKDPSTVPVEDRYWHQDFECYANDAGQCAYRALGRPYYTQMTDFPDVIENRKLYTDFIHKLRLSDSQRWTDASNGSAGQDSECFFPHHQRSGGGLPGPGVGQRGKGSSSEPYILLGNVEIKTRMGPMHVYGRVSSTGEVHDIFLRPVHPSEPPAQTGSRGASGPLVPMTTREAGRTDLDVKERRFARTVLHELKMSATQGLTKFSDCDPIPETTEDSFPEKEISSLAKDHNKIEEFHRDFVAQLKRSSSGSKLCQSCFIRNVDCIFVGCGHMISCKTCGLRLNRCPKCNRQIDAVRKIAGDS